MIAARFECMTRKTYSLDIAKLLAKNIHPRVIWVFKSFPWWWLLHLLGVWTLFSAFLILFADTSGRRKGATTFLEAIWWSHGYSFWKVCLFLHRSSLLSSKHEKRVIKKCVYLRFSNCTFDSSLRRIRKSDDQDAFSGMYVVFNCCLLAYCNCLLVIDVQYG